MKELQLFWVAAACYTFGTAMAFVYLYSREEKWSAWMRYFLYAGAAAHLASFGVRLHGFWRIEENRYFLPINSFFGALSFLALATAVVFVLVEGRHRLGILGAFVLPWALAASWGAVWRAH